MMDDPVIRFEQVTFAQGTRTVLDGISLAVGAGEIFGVVGADGAGKTTLLQLGTGQLAPAAGRVTLMGRTPSSDPAVRLHLAYMPQGFGLYHDLSVLENLAFFADLHGLAPVAARRRITDLLERTGLAGFEHRHAGKLSGGMMQKLALACALVSAPSIMFLDEPTTGVDPVSRRAFWALLNGVRAEGVAILYATANMDEAERCDRIGLLEDGHLRRQGTPAELAQVPTSVLLAATGPQGRRHLPALRALPGVETAFAVGLRVHVWVRREARRDFEAALRKSQLPLSVEPVPPTLQDVVLRELKLEAERAA